MSKYWAFSPNILPTFLEDFERVAEVLLDSHKMKDKSYVDFSNTVYGCLVFFLLEIFL